ncbi:MAG: ABC transporter substrate-binding protein, partial [Casimicrobiaceae bacterium]
TAVTLSSAGCATRSYDAANDDEFIIGLVAPTSGFAADYGPEAAQGLELALTKAGNEAGGKKVTVVKVNEDVLDPSQTLERVKKLVETDGADVVIGPIFGSSQQADPTRRRRSDRTHGHAAGTTQTLAPMQTRQRGPRT